MCEVYLVVLCVPFDLKGYLSQNLSKCIEQISKKGLALTARAQGVKTVHTSLCFQSVFFRRLLYSVQNAIKWELKSAHF